MSQDAFQRQNDCYRILLTDDNPAILRDYRQILTPGSRDQEPLRAAAASFFGDEPAVDRASGLGTSRLNLEIDDASQGKDAVGLIRAAIDQHDPYAVVFVDMRMPPGIDGLETIERIWAVDPHVQTVICSAHSDHTHSDILARLGDSDRLLILRKPFDSIEVSQIVSALTAKWDASAQMRDHLQRLEDKVSERTRLLEASNLELRSAMRRQIAAEANLRTAALHDALTGLPNRLLLTEHLETYAALYREDATQTWGVLFLDLDNFKVVNDGLGHAVGDLLLVEVAHRLLRNTDALRKTSENLDVTVSRLGGDEFVIGLGGIDGLEDASRIARVCHEALEKPFRIESREIHADFSIGIAVADQSGQRPECLLRDADTALYHAKSSGKARTSPFDQPMREAALERLTLETDLRRAFELRELWLAYQPIVSLENREIQGAEALLRWDHPTLGPIGPDRFVPIAEETGLIRELGQWVLEEACRQTADWKRRFPAHPFRAINVNVSPRQVFGGGLADLVEKTLAASGLEPRQLKIEITEGLLLREDATVCEELNRVRASGASLVLDDFGTGYSSLSYLHRLPVDGIKLDRSFIRQLPGDRAFANTVQALVTLAANRNMKVVAEGVETLDQVVQLQALDCDFAQGYYFSRPVPAADFERLLGEESSHRSAA